jgi:ABC-2 type transport system ATP-binding protein
MLAVDHSEIERVAELVMLAHRLDQRVGTYSLGMRQRLGIAQAMLGKPKLLILDEPANGLDPAGIREIRGLLRALAREGMSIFVSSHLLAEVELMCDRVGIIHRGRLLREGTVAEMISSRREMEFRVDDAAKAVAVLRERGVEARAETDRIWIAIDESETPPVVSALASNGIAVFHAQRRVETLEDLFLQATGGETVG